MNTLKLLLVSLSLFAGQVQATEEKDVVAEYQTYVYNTYQEAYAKAAYMQTAIEFFLSAPSEMSLNMAKQAWREARVPYSKSEVFRFYGGPIDNEETGPEGLMNAWPLDEAYIDYVKDGADVGIVLRPDLYPSLSKELLMNVNELDGEKNISTGYHAIEFLLWGQDLSLESAGRRPYEDYVTGSGRSYVERRKEYLTLTTELLMEHLAQMVDAWDPAQENYAKEFGALPEKEALKNIFTGMVYLLSDEMAGERMFVSVESGMQEDEQSCFSDNTLEDLKSNLKAVMAISIGTDGKDSALFQLVQSKDSFLAQSLKTKATKSVELMNEIPAPYDWALQDDEAKEKIMVAIDGLLDYNEVLLQIAELLGFTVE